MKVVSWFSCGAASAVASKLAIKKYNDVDVVRIELASEHSDNDRFAKDISNWLNRLIKSIRHKEYKSSWDVFNAKKYIQNQYGAPCTLILKKQVREEYERNNRVDLQIFGYTFEEKHRAERLQENFPEIKFEFPLIDNQLSKADCLAIIQDTGIELPEMYKLGFNNNNCIGCPKGGMGYWNKIRKEFPEQFERMEKLERTLKYSIFDCYLDELDPNAGRHNEPEISCSMFCYLAEV